MKVMLHYKLIGAVEVDVPEDKITDEKYLRDFVNDGKVSDDMLLSGIESSDAFGIDGDAIEIIATSQLDGDTIAEFNKKPYRDFKN
jgi:hypothetical protein